MAEQEALRWKKLPFFIRASGITNILIWGLMAVQYLYFFAVSGALFTAIIGEFYVMCLGLVFSGFALFCFRKNTRLYTGIGNGIQFTNALVFLALALFFNGPFSILLFLVEIGLACFNILAVIEASIVSKKLTRNGASKPFTLQQRRQFLRSGAMIVVICTAGLGVASMNSFWMTVTVQAPATARTTSSYWGGPTLLETPVTKETMPVNNWTLLITPGSIFNASSDFGNGSIARVETVYLPPDTVTNYMNYTKGARSYPNGTVTLSAPLPITTANVSITFTYIRNWPVLQMLGETNATVIENRFGDYIYDADPFADIGSTYMFQLYDYWNVKFYLQVNAFGEYSHVFNYLNVVPRAIQALDWASSLWQQFLGVSFDCEQEEFPQSPLNRPGYIPLFPGSLIPDSWGGLKKYWYWLNEQNETLYAAARAAYEGVFQHALDIGKEVYVVLVPSDFSEYIDSDQDYHANPTLPFTTLPNVRYGQMSYHNDDPAGGFACYRDCVEQIQQLGSRGQSMLLGWISNDATYYTNNETGFQRYVDDCLIAQAAGITEIFHAPIYKLQEQFGDGVVVRLHDLLNEASKERYVIRVVQFTYPLLWDFWKNFNKPLLGLIVCGTILAISIVEIFSKIKARSRKGH
nr:hypothetical protein [Candidatus Sigynarchaeota archaeon]